MFRYYGKSIFAAPLEYTRDAVIGGVRLHLSVLLSN